MIDKIFFWKKIGAGIMIFICVLAIIALCSSSAKGESSNEIVLNFSFSEPVITQWNVSNTTYHNVTMNDIGIIENIGLPIVPVKQLNILLPQKGIVKSINVTHSNYISLGNGYNVTPGGLLTNLSEVQQNPYNETLFNSSRAYPTQIVRNLGIGYYRGYSILSCYLYPVYYINDTGEIYYYQFMNLTITTNNSGTISKFFRGLEQDEIMMKQLVDDYSMNYTYNSTLELPANSTIIKQNEHFDFVIITIEDFVDAPAEGNRDWKTFQDLADYKNDYTEFKTKIVTVEEILSDPAYYNTSSDWGDGDYAIFNDTQCRIRNFIKHAWGTWGVDYVLFGGDNSTKVDGEILPVIPARELWTVNPEGYLHNASLYLEIPSDLYYACLDGSYNENRNNRWGEPFDGNVSGDWEEPPERSGSNYYAEADINQYKTDFEVGLFTPSLNLSECESVSLKFESNFRKKNVDTAQIKVLSGSPESESAEDINIFNIGAGSKTIIIENIVEDFSNKDEVYVEFFYKMCYEDVEDALVNISWNIDKILINETDVATNVFLYEDFDDPWIENEDEDLVPDLNWKQKMYSGTEGKWTQEHYKEDVDLIGEVYIGRAPVGKEKEVSNFVIKTLEYEEIRDHDPFVEKLLLIGGRLGWDSWGKTDCTMVSEEIPDDEYSNTTLYDKETERHGNHIVCDYYKDQELRNELNDNHHLIYNSDHGFWNNIHRYSFFYKTQLRTVIRLHNGDVLFLSNKKPFFWYSSSCLTGKFDEEDCLAEFLVVKTKHSAFAVIMNAEISWDIRIEDNRLLEEWFYYLMFTGVIEPINEIGGANQESKNKAKETIEGKKYIAQEYRITVYGRNLLGDPTLSIKHPKTNHEPVMPDPDYDMRYEKIDNTLCWYKFFVKTTDPDGDIIRYHFKVDDTELKITTRYYNSGEEAYMLLRLPSDNYEIRVKANDTYGKASSWSSPYDLETTFNLNIQTDTSPVVLEDEVQFIGIASGGNEPYTSWNYDFGDGYYSQEQNPSHAYGSLGTYNVTLNVTDSQNVSSKVSKVINVVILNADFENSPGLAVSNLEETFYFNDKSKGYYDTVNWSWDFGDGNTSYERNTSHVYSSEGTYNVSLTVTDDESNNDSFYQMIYIDSVSPTIESVSSNFDVVGYGTNVTISVNTSDNSCGIKSVGVNITYPDSSYGNYSMNNTIGSIYEYVFSDCWQLGEYSYKVWVVDQANNVNCASEDSFVVSRSFGYNKIGSSNQTIWDTITGSVFRLNERGVADNISVYLDPGNASSDFHYTAVIYRHNDSVLIGTSEEKNITNGKGWQIFNFSVPKPVLINDTEYILACWSDNNTVKMYYDSISEEEMFYDDGTSTLKGHYFEGIYNYIPDPIWFDHEDRNYSIYCCYTLDNTSPEITNVSDNPNPAGFGFNVTITSDIIEYQSGINIIKVNITYPNSTQYSYDMNHTENNTYEFVFNNTWVKGQYNYSIWTVDYANNSNSSSGHSFTVSGQATISVCTIKDEYGNNEAVNLTDPPGNSPLIGYELLDDGEVLRMWNQFDSYYFDTNSGIQLTNHYNDYWSHNVLMLGYYNNDQWNLLYRTDALSGFNKDIDTDGETYVNATLWKDLSYAGYDFRLAIRYYLGVDDNELTVIPYIKNLGEAIPYALGFGWEMKDIQINMTTSGDYINVNRTMYYLNQTLDNVYTDLAEPLFYLMENITDSTTKSLYLRWNQSLNYKLCVKSREGQYNAPVTLFIRVGTLNEGQEKYTEMYWYDAEQVTYYFDSFDDGPYGEAWAVYPNFMVDGSLSNWASTTSDGDVELCDENDCPGDDLGTISKVELRVRSYYSGGQRDTILRPVYGGTNDGMECRYSTGPSIMWSEWFDITYHQYAPLPWGWDDIVSLDCDVVAENDPMGPPFTLYCSKVELRVTYTPSNYDPVISDLVPADCASGVGIQPVLNITVSDPDGDNMNITWLSNSSGSWQVFGTNCSVGNGTYHQIMGNVSVNGQWWYWMVNVSDGTEYMESSVYKFYTGYQSKIKNTGSTAIKGYLLIQVQYYNTSSSIWVLEQEVVNETTSRTINASDVLALDTIFNAQNVSTSSFSNGNGTYRIYVAFRNPDGNILVTDDETELVATYEFTIDFD